MRTIFKVTSLLVCLLFSYCKSRSSVGSVKANQSNTAETDPLEIVSFKLTTADMKKASEENGNQCSAKYFASFDPIGSPFEKNEQIIKDNLVVDEAFKNQASEIVEFNRKTEKMQISDADRQIQEWFGDIYENAKKLNHSYPSDTIHTFLENLFLTTISDVQYRNLNLAEKGLGYSKEKILVVRKTQSVESLLYSESLLKSEDLTRLQLSRNEIVDQVKQQWIDIIQNMSDIGDDIKSELQFRIINAKIEFKVTPRNISGLTQPSVASPTGDKKKYTLVGSENWYDGTPLFNHKLFYRDQNSGVKPDTGNVDLYALPLQFDVTIAPPAVAFVLGHEIFHLFNWAPKKLASCLIDRQNYGAFLNDAKLKQVVFNFGPTQGVGTKGFNELISIFAGRAPLTKAGVEGVWKIYQIDKNGAENLAKVNQTIEAAADYFGTKIAADFIKKNYAVKDQEKATLEMLSALNPTFINPILSQYLNQAGSKRLNEDRVAKIVFANPDIRSLLGGCAEKSAPTMCEL